MSPDEIKEYERLTKDAEQIRIKMDELMNQECLIKSTNASLCLVVLYYYQMTKDKTG